LIMLKNQNMYIIEKKQKIQIRNYTINITYSEENKSHFNDNNS